MHTDFKKLVCTAQNKISVHRNKRKSVCTDTLVFLLPVTHKGIIGENSFSVDTDMQSSVH